MRDKEQLRKLKQMGKALQKEPMRLQRIRPIIRRSRSSVQVKKCY